MAKHLNPPQLPDPLQLPNPQQDHDSLKWTVMVYMAADTTLINFAIESLKQMKASHNTGINIVAELDCGRSRSTERYFFGKDPHKGTDYLLSSLESIVNNIVLRLEPQDPGDPETLTNFIDWSVNNYQADHYFLIIWGHGSGIDDDSFDVLNGARRELLVQDRNDRFYIPRHYPLPTTDIQLAETSLKSVAFVDSPISYLTNEALKKALKDAHDRIATRDPKWKLDLLGMDACNMNLIELGYEVRKYADYLIASQDEIPDASWPYYNILSTLGVGVVPGINAIEPDPVLEAICKKGACKEEENEQDQQEEDNNEQDQEEKADYVYASVQKIVEAYAEAYQDYVDQPVALSALNLTHLREKADGLTGAKIRPLFDPLIKVLQLHTTYREINDAIIFARRRVRSFYTRLPNTRDYHTRDIYIDLIHFCKLLYSFLQDHPEHKKLQCEIRKFICNFKNRKIIAANETTKGEDECNGTSIYFPAHPDDEFRSFYEQLEFAQETHWGAFVTKFLDKNPDLFIPPKFEVRAGRVKGNPHDHVQPRDLVKGNPRIPEKGNPRLLDKVAGMMIPGANPMIVNHAPEDNINPSIYNRIYNYGTIVELGCDEDLEDQ